MTNQTDADPLNAHYGTADLIDRVRAALHAAGMDVAPTLDDLGLLDQFHIAAERRRANSPSWRAYVPRNRCSTSVVASAVRAPSRQQLRLSCHRT